MHHSDADPLRFVDQRWLDLTVNYFDVDVLRDRGANVAYWNLDTRALEHGPSGYTVDGEPLRFMHLSGFDPSRPGRLTKHPARVEAGHSPALAQICREYATALVDAGVQPKTGPSADADPGGLDRPDAPDQGRTAGSAPRPRLRRRPDPRAAADVLAWLHAPVTPRGTSRYLIGLHASHAAVRREFAQVPGDDEPRYQGWAATQGVAHGPGAPRPRAAAVTGRRR